MATKPGTKIGTMPCPEHPSLQLLVRKNENGTHSARCDECDDTHYAKAGTGKLTAWLPKIKPLAGAAPLEDKKTEEGKATAKGGVFPTL